MGFLDSLTGRKPPALLGLDIGSRSIKLVQLAESARGVDMVSFGVTATPEEAISGGLILEVGKVAACIKQLLEVAQVPKTQKRVMLSVPGRNLVMRPEVLPPGKFSNDEKRSAVANAVERFLPVPLGEMYTDVQSMGFVEGEGAKDKKEALLFVGCQKEIVRKRADAVVEAGLEPVAIDAEPLVLIRSLIERPYKTDAESFQEATLLVDLGAGSTSISVVKDGRLRFTRITATGGDQLTEAVQNQFGCTWHEAELAKRKLGFAILPGEVGADTLAASLYNAMEDPLQNMMDDMRRSLAFYSSKWRNETVSKIVLTGGGALMRGMTTFFERELGIPTRVGDLLQGGSGVALVGKDAAAAEQLKMSLPYLGVAMGLALGELSPRTQAKVLVPVLPAMGYEARAAGGGGPG